ncbi:hypothetical protein Chy4_0042 [Mycobacterium phage Chy4]|uniref:hypothetical protein n=1 Tax=Mycobacterium phage Chy4 TaxID=1327947 RepID=UPI00032B49DE|nr:hypothetical protein M179_gp42 [Mycobacterium phage Chy4]AGK86004.1 hypothetical protein Chy4_0042 [Mycobacterium phage Chy4]
MADRIQVVIALPRDEALPIDVQAVGLRRMAIDLMKEVADVEENTVRYSGGTDNATINFGGEIGLLTTWQHNLLAARFVADGTAKKEVVGPIVHRDTVTRVHSSASVERNPY